LKYEGGEYVMKKVAFVREEEGVRAKVMGGEVVTQVRERRGGRRTEHAATNTLRLTSCDLHAATNKLRLTSCDLHAATDKLRLTSCD